MEVHALRQRGWSISAIARHTGRDRKTVRAYLNGDRIPGVRVRAVDPFAPFLDYVTARLVEDPHLWALTLFDELLALGFVLSYQSLTREIRDRGLRPVCTACATATDRVNGIIEHPPGAETQWDWLELPDPPASWGWGATAHLLVGSLAHSGKWRAVLCESEDQPHLIEGIDRITRALGGVTHSWRFDRMATVCHPASGRVTASFAGVAKHYGVTVSVCPPYSGHRKGVVEKINHSAAQRWWRTLSDELTVEQAQASVDTFAAVRGDTRVRAGHLDAAGAKVSVATVAKAESLRPPPAFAYPVILTDDRVVSRQALVAYRGNRYSVPPELAGTRVAVTRPVGAECIDIATSSGIVIARHRLLGDGTGAVVRDGGHVIALEQAAMAAAATSNGGRPHRRKERIPPGPAALAAAAALRPAAPSPDALPRQHIWHRHRHHENGHRSRGLRTCRPRKEHPHMTTKTGTVNSKINDAGSPMQQPIPAPNTAAAASLYQQLRGHLAVLKLHDAAEALPTVLDAAAAEQLSMTAALERLLAIEVDATEARRLAGRLRFACLPTPATLADFDYDAAAGVDRALINELGTCRYLESATNVLMIGPPGVGKTHLSVGLARAAAHAGYRTYFTTAADLAARCHRAAIEGRWATTMRFFAGPTLLVIDELGYLPLPGEAASALFQVVSQRYLKTSIVITTNRGVGAWGEILGDTTVAAAMLDRLLHRSVVLNLDGDSYRLRDHHARNNTLRATTTGTRQPLT